MKLDMFGPLGRRQRVMLRRMADEGRWWPGANWRPLSWETMSVNRAVAGTLTRRRLLTVDLSNPDGWAMAPAGYAWLIREAAAEMAGVSPESEAYAKVTTRIQHLAAVAHLAAPYPVNWRGERA